MSAGRAVLVALLALLAGCATSGAATRADRPAAQADSLPRVVVVLAGGISAEPDELPRGARVLRAAAPLSSPAAEAAASLERARTSYRDLAFDDALAGVGEAQLLLEARAHDAADFDALTQALLYRGMAELALGREERAREALRTVVLLRPALVLDETRFAPEVRALHGEIAGAVRAEPPSAITLTAEPADAYVALDGRSLGRAPLTVQGGSGRHYVEVSALGFETRLLSVVLAPGGSPALHVALPRAGVEEVTRALGSGRLAPSEHERAALRAVLGAERLIVVGRRPGGVQARRLDLVSGRAREHRASSVRGAIAALAPVPRSRRAPAPPDDRSASWLASPWPWVVLGAVVAGAVTGSVVAITRDSGTQVVLTPEP